MKLLLDQNLSPRLKGSFASLFDEVLHVGDLGLEETSDADIWRLARNNDWVVMSKDGDFADMALLYGGPPKIIRLRIGNGPWRIAGTVVNENADAVRSFLEDPVSSLLLLGLHDRGPASSE